MFAELIAGRTPLAFNCSGGKDRTGMGAAILLTTLGVPHDQVAADYALSDKVMDYEAIARATAPDAASAGFGGMARLAPEVRRPMMASDPAYLKAGLAAVVRRDGSVANFVTRRLGVSPQQVSALRDQLLKQT
jgi:protein-tyrosine phosphatase